MPTIHKPSRRSLIVQCRKHSRLLVLICLVLCVATVGYVSNHAKSAVAPSVANSTPIESFNVGMKMGRYKIQLGRDTATTYRAGLFSAKAGNTKIEAAASYELTALQSGQVQPLSMANEDFDGDGTQDLVIGYAGGAGGLLTLRRGNIEAISPRSPEAQAGLREGRYQSPFVNDVDAYAVPENPDFLATGDFDADGYSDVVAAARNGQRLYFFAGDGKGGFKAMEQISLPGMITAMTQGHFNESGGLTSLAVSVVTLDGPRVLVYDEGGEGVNGEADSFALPAPANTLMLGNVDGDTAGDLIVGASNHVVMIHGRNPAERAANQNRVEQFDVPYDIAAVSAGDFLFDREGKMKLALLSGDGTIHFLAPGALDTRPFTREEVLRMQKQRQTIRRGEADEASFQGLLKSMVQRSGTGDGWTEQESRSTAATSFGGNPQALLTKTATAGALLDQLLVLEPANNKVELIDHDDSIKPASLRQPDGTASVDTFDTEAAPIAVATMRLSVSGRLGTIILQSNQPDPGLIVPMANTWNVNSNVDAVDDSPGNSVCHTSGGVCTLRAAMMESSYRGGDNIINLQTATYTLSVNGVSGGADNEFSGAGDDQTGGDLDIVDLPDICAFLGGCPGLSLGSSLTSVTINGNGIANTIIQMGALGNICNTGGKDRILDVNPSADPQFPTNVTINSLTMQNGSAPNWNTTLAGCGGGGGFFHSDGGAIQFDGTKSQAPNAGPTGVLTLTTVKITSNTSAGQGGGVFINWGSGLIQTNSLITSNTTTFGSGGGLSYNGGNINLTQTLSISGTMIGGVGAANTAPDTTFGNGGGLNTNGGTGVTISSSTTISNNTAGNQGGGISFANSPVIAVSNSTISSNTAKTNGGGIYCSARNAITNVASTATLTTTSVTSNTADSDNNNTGDGGGIYNLMGTLTVQTTSHIDGNSAINGGGIFDTWTANTNDTPAQLVVNTSSTIGQTGSGNSAKNNGGGIGIDVGSNSATTPKVGTATITGVTIQANTANSDSSGGGDGGGIYEDGNDTNFEINVTLDSSTIDNNVANSGTGDGIKMDSGTITLANAGTNALTNGDNFSMAGGTLNAGNGTFNISGNFAESGGTFNTGNGTINLTGNYNQSGGAFADGTGTLNIGGNFTFSGGTFTANQGTVAFNGSSAQSATGAVTFFNLTINNASGVTLNNNDTVNGTLTLTNGALSIGSTTLTLNSTVSFTSGTISSGNTGTVSYNQGSNGQAVAPGTYGNLTFSNFNKTLPNGSTVSISNTFTTGSAVGHTITGSTVDFNGTGAQTVPAFNFNNLTISGARTTNSVTLASSGTIGIAGTFSPTATFTSGNYIVTGSTVDFNGTGAQTVPAFNYNNLTISQARTTNSVTLANGGTIGIAGTFNPSATFTSGAFVNTNNTIDFNGTGAQTVPAFNYNNLTISQARGANSVTLVNGGTIGIAGTFNPSATFSGGGFVVTNNTVNFNGTGAQTVPQFNFNNLTISQARGANNVTLANGGTIGIAGTFNPSATFSGGGFVITNNTINFNGTGAQTVPAFNYNNLTISGAHTTNSVTLANGGTIGIAGAFSPTATFTSGNYVVTNNTVDFNGSGAQTVPAFSFNNLIISQARAANSVTFVNGGTIKIAGTLTSTASFTSGQFVLTNNTVEYNGASAQALSASFLTYNNLTLNNAAGVTGVSGLTVNGLLEVKAGTFTSATTYNNVQIDSGATLAGNGSEIDVSGNWTNNGTFTANASLVKFNGSGAQSIGGSNSTTFASLTIANSGNTVSLGINTSVAGDLLVSSGTFDLGSFTANRTASGGQISISNGATLKIGGSNTFPSNYTAHLLGQTSTVDYNNNSNLSQTISAESYGNLTCNGNGARVLASSGTIGIFTTFTPGTHTYTITGSTVEYNSTTAPQTLPSSGFNTYNNLTINNTGGGVTGFAGLTVNGLLDVKAGTFTSSSTYNNVQIDSGATLAGTNATTINVTGNWTNNGGSGTSFTANGNTVAFNGSGSQTIQGNTLTTFNNLTINNAVTPVALGIDATVNGTLTLTRDLNASTFTLIEPVSAPASAGTGDVIGKVQRTNSPNPMPTGTAFTFGNPFNSITFDALSVLPPTDVTVSLAKSAPGTFPPPPPVTRTYTITQNNGGAFLATLQLHYLDAELNGNNETNLKLWRFDGVSWVNMGALNHDPTNNWVRQNNIATFSDWTLAADATPTATSGDVSGRIADGNGNPIEGTAVRLSGTQNRLTVTDANGNYRFDNVETNGFYTVTPARANFTFSPAQRSFSQLGLHTEAAFSANATSTTVNPLDTTEYFVRQQYVDFLNREPDEAGFNFWVNNIESCGTDETCRAVKRIDTSAAFFLSIEFQQTGYLVERAYKTAYGNMPNAPVPLTLSEFKPDTQEIGSGVIVTQSGWEQKLESNKQAFMTDFVQRSRFVSAYPTTMTPAEFVDKLFANAGVTPSAADRSAAISEFGSSATTSDTAARSRALRRVAESAAVTQKEFDSAFVLMEYFGYLRRDPNSGQDTNFDGYNFWLNKLDTFGGNYQNAEMVKAFLTSIEYRGRFPR